MRLLKRVGSLALVAFLAAGSVPAGAGVTGDVITGSDVTNAITLELVPALRTTFPSLAIGKVVCPDYMDLSGNRQETCTVAVEDAQLPIAVSAGPDAANPFTFQPAARLLVGSQVDALVAHDVLEGSGIAAQADCGPQRVHVLAAGASLRCNVQGPGLRTVLTITMQADGDVFVPRLPGRIAPLERELQNYEALHREGKPTDVPGTVLGAVIGQAVNDGLRAERDVPQVTATVHCPALGDLSGSRQVACYVFVATLHLPYDVWMTGDTMHLQSDLVWDFSRRIAATATDYYRAKLSAAGLGNAVDVDCGSPRWVALSANDALACTLSGVRNEKHKLTIHIDPATGRTRYFVDPR
jgi:hypothetical protein